MVEKKREKVMNSIFSGWSVLTNYEYNRLGRIWVLWKDGVRVTPVFKSGQIITCSILMAGKDEEFFCSFIYASNQASERKELWQDICSHHNSPLIRNKPWILCGDFNETLLLEEHSNYEATSIVSGGMKDFQETVDHCLLQDMGYHGPLFTWCNKRREGLVCKKLDRVLINEKWLETYPHSYNVFEAGGCSDHLRTRITWDRELSRGRRPFKFTNAIIKFPQFTTSMEVYWRDTEELFVSTSATFRFMKKLKGLKPILRSLSKDTLGDISKRTKEAYVDLCSKQEILMQNPSDQHIEDESEANNIWQQLSEMEEEVLKQQAKLHWLDVGDRNNVFFYKSIQARKIHNTIRELKSATGEILKSQEDIKNETKNYYYEFLNKEPPDFIGMTVEQLQEILNFRCSETDRAQLAADVSETEIQKTLFSMPNNKSPGPDGYTSEFFKATWPVIGKDLLAAVKSFFIKGFLPKGLNSTILVLIPKKDNAVDMQGFRPISLCNVLYKLISKIIANRLKKILPKFISQNQSAFVKERLLMENVLLASEVVKDYHKESLSPRGAMKIDISKAFDTVQWSFLLNTLAALNFPDKFIHWIRLCITSASFSVQVNGELAGFFRSKRGLRQGCCLSPYLFVICMNVLSRLIDSAAVKRSIGYHPRCKQIQLTHLCFADDLMIFVDGKQRSVEGVLDIFNSFGKYSGLHISIEKSTLYLAGTDPETRDAITSTFPFATGALPVRYLGLPLLTKRMMLQDYQPLLERIRTKMRSWSTRFLSYVGRLQLINSIILGTINFWTSAYRLPNACIKELDKLCSAFLWSGPDLNPRKAKIAWTEICRPKAEGGLAIRSLKEANTVSCLKLIWRILSGQDSLWVNWIATNCLRKDNFWTVKENANKGSWMWRKLIKYRDKAREFYSVKVQNGQNTSFWYDVWSRKGRLLDITGIRGVIDLGIPALSTVASAIHNRRTRRHMAIHLNEIEDEIQRLDKQNPQNDIPLWKISGNKFSPKFVTKHTWNQVRATIPEKTWHKAVWFKDSTPKFSFITWMAAHNRLTTGDRKRLWNAVQRIDCVFCGIQEETRNHLFFTCPYSTGIWSKLMGNMLGTEFVTDWEGVILLLTNQHMDKEKLFLLRYAFQVSLYYIWRERNNRRHGTRGQPVDTMVKQIDRGVKDRLISISRKKNEESSPTLLRWLQYTT